MLEVQDLEVRYGRIRAVVDVSLRVDKGEIVGLMGPNGAGKSSVIKSIIGLVRPTRGRISFMNKDIQDLATEDIIVAGIAMAPEGRELFPYLTVEENLLMGAIGSRSWKAREDRLEFAYSIFPRLKERKKQIAKSLSGGEQQMLTIARALMSDPKLLLVDEPSLGLSPKVTSLVFKLLKSIREEGITILLADQNARRILDTCDRAYLIENGRIVKEGRTEDLKEDKTIKEVYLGL